MSDKERDLYVPRRPEFQSTIVYKDIEKSPWLVVRQTNDLLHLFHQGPINNSKLAKEYFHDYTISYLKAAEEGLPSLSTGPEPVSEDIDPEAKEAAGHVATIFGSMPGWAKGKFLTVGYSKRGILRAPGERKEFQKRIRELKLVLWQVANGGMEPRATLEAYPSFLRTFKFFEVGSELPIKLSPDQKQQEEMDKEKLETLLDGIDVSL